VIYTLVYKTYAQAVSASSLATAWGLVPTDATIEAADALILVSDTITTAARVVTRTIVYNTTPATPIADPGSHDLFTNLYTQYFRAALASWVTADPVVP
jgi:hypothetical protein